MTDPAARECTGEYSCRGKTHAPTCLYGRTPEMVHREAYTIVAATLMITATELAALKARRCDGCLHGEQLVQGEGEPRMLMCFVTDDDHAPMLVNDTLIVAPDHACNAWTPREAQ